MDNVRGSLPVTVVVPTWQRPKWLELCLDGVLSQTPPAAEVLVVGRDDDRATKLVVQKYGERVRWGEVSRAGHVDPIRTALTTVRTPYFVMIDDDAVPVGEAWLDGLVRVLREADVACVGSQVRNVGAPPRKMRRGSGRLRWYGRIVGNVAGRTDQTPVPVSALCEANWAWRTEVLAQCRIDEIWDKGDATMYSLDLCLQAQRRGWRVMFTSDSPVIHHLAPRDSSLSRERSEENAFAYNRNLTYIALKHYRWRLLPFVLWSVAVGDMGYYGLASAALGLATSRSSFRLVRASVAGRVAGVREWQRRTH